MNTHKYFYLVLLTIFLMVFTTNIRAQDICSSRAISSTQSCSNPDALPYNFKLSFPNLSNPNFLLHNATFQESLDNNGIATLIGTLINVADSTIQFSVHLTFQQFSESHTANLSNPCLTNVDATNFYYYTSFQGTITGINQMEGAYITVINSGNALQLGYGANWFNKDLRYGAASKFVMVLATNPQNGFILAPIVRGGTYLPGHLALNLTDCNICAQAGGDTDGDGICDAEDCAPNDETLPAEPGAECDDGNNATINDIILEDGCSCLGEEEEEEEYEEEEEEESSEVVSEVCTVRTAFNTTLCQGNFEGINYGGYLLLEGLGRHYSLVNGQFAEYNDGTARLIGEWVNIDNNEIKFQVDVTLEGRTASTPPNSPKGHWCLEPNQSDFYYYTQTKGVLRGKDAIEGALLMIGRAGPAFQFGVGANPTNAELTFGAAGWLTATIVNQPSTDMELTLLTSAKGSNGDININLSGDPMTCIDNREYIAPSCLEDITLTAAIGATSKIAHWETPTFSSSCLFNPNRNCATTPDQITGFNYLGALAGSKYFCSSTSFTYAQAKSLAIQQGGYLAVICDQAENDFITSKLTPNVAWIGFSDEVKEGTFIWANGASCTYTNWSGSEPNNGHNTDEFTGANQAVLQKNSGKWLDRNGQAKYKFILEVPCTGNMLVGTAEMVQKEGPVSGTSFPIGETTILYEGKDGCGNTTSCSFKVIVQAPNDPCAGDNAPKVTVETQNPDCEGNKGKIIFNFNDHPSRTHIEFSLDGGQTYPLYIKDNVGTALFDDLSAGSYDIYVRWGNNECPVDLGMLELVSEKLTPGATCDDNNNNTQNDRIQADGCTCEGVPFGVDKCAVRTAFNTVRCMDNNYFETNYGGYLLLKGLERHYSLVNGQLIEYSNGTAVLTGEWINIADDKIRFEVNVSLSGRTANTPPNSPKGHLCLSPVESDFYYYTQTTGILTGKDKIAGATIMVGRAGPAFQFGVGANPTNNELIFGAAGWLTATIVNQPSTNMQLTLETSPKGSNGDININLNGASTACLDNPGSITANCLEDITVTAASGANNKTVTWDTPTFSSDCLFDRDMDCATLPEQMEGFEYVGSFNGSKYYCSTTDDFTYQQARSLSIQNGGHLAVICSQEENNFLAGRIGAEEVWIGYFDAVNEGNFVWSNGAYCGYTNWSSGEPNNGHSTNEFTGADYTILSKGSGVWKDRNGAASYEFIMEVPCSGAMSTGTAAMIQKQGPTSGKAFPIGETTIVYEGKDDCGNSTTCSFKVIVKAPTVTDPCAGDKAPQATVNLIHPDCDADNGKIKFSFNDRSGRSNIEFSLDGGQTYPLNVKDNLGTATFNDLGIGDYHLLVRWGNNECPVDLGTITLNEITKTPDESCDDKDDSTENDVIQADGCTCLGELVEDSEVVGNGGCGTLLSNPSFEDGLNPWKFNSNTQYNRSTRYRADGNYMVWIYKRYSHKKDAVIYQDAVALPGAKYSFSFYSGTHRPNYNHEVAIEFYNQYGAQLKRKAVQIDFDVDNGSILKEYQLSEIAPSGTTKIRFIGTADGDYLKLDAICVQVDKTNVQTRGRAADEKQEESIVEDTEVFYQGFDAITLGSRIKKEGVQLDWFAKNNNLPSKFIVEKSLDGQNFEQIDEVVVDDIEDLSILDEAPDFGTNYYRIIQQFETGQEIVSNIREEKYLIDPASITIYPNPVSDNLNLRIGHFQALKGTVRIFSPVGQQVFERAIDKEDKHISIDVSTYKNGMYFLLIEAENRRPIERQIIVENLE